MGMFKEMDDEEELQDSIFKKDTTVLRICVNSTNNTSLLMIMILMSTVGP
jgi:hypothetical protein